MSSSFRKTLQVYLSPNTQAIAIKSGITGDIILFDDEQIKYLTAKQSNTILKSFSRNFDICGCLGVLNTKTGSTLIVVRQCQIEVSFRSSSIYRVTQVDFLSAFGNPNHLDPEHVKGLKEILEDGSFFFSADYDLSLNFQRATTGGEVDEQYLWNNAILKDFEAADIPNNFFLHCIRGFIQFRTLFVSNSKYTVGLISRLSCGRAGTRFQTRGVDDDGNVANFVETEQILEKDGFVTSHVQLRGTVPLFWEQPGVNFGKHKVTLSRSFEAMLPAFRKHFETQEAVYGHITCVNLLGTGEGEKLLSDAFEDFVKEIEEQNGVSIVSFDFHAFCKGGKYDALSLLMDRVVNTIEDGSFFAVPEDSTDPCNIQTNVLRTNCLDCLDRTNAVQQLFGHYILDLQLDNLGVDRKYHDRFKENFKTLWFDNGNMISKNYAGTGAMKAEFTLTGKRTAKGMMEDGVKSVSRMYKNNVKDFKTQEIIDSLLMNNCLTEKQRTIGLRGTLRRRLKERYTEFTETSEISVCVASWNVNGGRNADAADLHEWLLDPIEENGAPDIYAIGFQEIVNIDVGNILKEDAGNRESWEKNLKAAINQLDRQYTMVVQQQLVGVCLFIFVAHTILDDVRDVVIAQTKVGVHGLAGNKGGVVAKFKINDTSVCFVCAHLAAGQSNVQHRIEDYDDITKNTNLKGKTILSNDYVFWFGDFNFRIELPIDEVKHHIKKQNYSTLFKRDQLIEARAGGRCFVGFHEGPITFDPTYKFDLNSDVYDTSEKQRIPAWTDRILYYTHQDAHYSNVDLHYYNSCPLRFSDHRPVTAVMTIDIATVDSKARKEIVRDMIGEGDMELATVLVHGLSLPISLEDIRRTMDRFGPVLAVKIHGTSAQVTFSNVESAAEAISYCNVRIGGSMASISGLDKVASSISLGDVMSVNTMVSEDMAPPRPDAPPAARPPRPTAGPRMRPTDSTDSNKVTVNATSSLPPARPKPPGHISRPPPPRIGVQSEPDAFTDRSGFPLVICATNDTDVELPQETLHVVSDKPAFQSRGADYVSKQRAKKETIVDDDFFEQLKTDYSQTVSENKQDGGSTTPSLLPSPTPRRNVIGNKASSYLQKQREEEEKQKQAQELADSLDSINNEPNSPRQYPPRPNNFNYKPVPTQPQPLFSSNSLDQSNDRIFSNNISSNSDNIDNSKHTSSGGSYFDIIDNNDINTKTKDLDNPNSEPALSVHSAPPIKPRSPSTTPLSPSTTPLLSSSSPLKPSTSPIIPSTTPLIPSTAPLVPTTTPLIPTTTTPLTPTPIPSNTTDSPGTSPPVRHSFKDDLPPAWGEAPIRPRSRTGDPSTTLGTKPVSPSPRKSPVPPPASSARPAFANRPVPKPVPRRTSNSSIEPVVPPRRSKENSDNKTPAATQPPLPTTARPSLPSRPNRLNKPSD